MANDWLHSNSEQYTSYDGNIIISMRHQDAVFKVNFAKGTGDGHIIWKLGNGPIWRTGRRAVTFLRTCYQRQPAAQISAIPGFPTSTTLKSN